VITADTDLRLCRVLGLSPRYWSRAQGHHRRRPTVQAIVLFESRAMGNAQPESDLDLLVVERTPHLDGQAKVASWWRHFEPLKSARLPVDLIVSGSADAARLAGSRWHVISAAARSG